MSVNKPEPIRDMAALLQLFKRVERFLWVANIEPGLPRFFDLATLLFVKLLAERQQDPSWESLKSASDKIRCLNDCLIPALRSRYNATDIFPESRITENPTLKSIIALLDKNHLTSLGSDILGDAYEYFLRNDMASRQSLGQFFTPRPLAKTLLALAAPTADDTVYDPFCGAGGLLVEAHNAIRESGSPNGKGLFFGREAASSARVARMNALLHWGDSTGIEQVSNTLEHPVHGKYSVGLANVPFARDPRNYPYNALYENGLAGKKTDMLSILHLFQAIKKGGRMAAIVPEGFLFGSERAKAKRFLTDNANLRLVTSLPHDMFRPYTQVKSAIIVFDTIHCPNPRGHFWYFDVQNGNDLDTLAKFRDTPEEKLPSLGYIKVDLEAVHRNAENWIGKHYLDTKGIKSPWPLVPVGQLVNFVSTGFSYKMSQLSEKGVPMFTLKSIGKDFFPKCETKFLHYETEISEKNWCFTGDILIALKDKDRKAALLGQATITDKKGVFSSDLAKIEITAKNALSSGYLWYCLKSNAYANEIRKFTVGSIVKSITLENIAAIKIPLPPLSVQKELVRELNRYEKIIASQTEAVNFFHEKCQERVRVLWG